MNSTQSRTGGARRAGRLWVGAIVVIIALALAGGVGYWLGTRPAPSGGPPPSLATTDDEQLYTCGMHPNVIQRGPGECPICHMKLTPLKRSDDAAASEHGPQERRVLYWRAPMDPSYVSDRPGKSPMGMDLVPVYADEGASSVAKTIRIDPVTVQNMGVRTATVTRGPLAKTIRTVGRVMYDEQTVTYIDTKYDGWIQTLHADETGMQVTKGEALFEVYSPKLYAAQEEYLAALRGAERLAESTLPEARDQAQELVEAAEVQLRYFDISDEQIAELRRAGEVTKTLTFNSPASGVITEKAALEGMYVKPGMRLFTIADLSRVWVMADVYEYQLPWVGVGQEAVMTLSYIPGREFRGRVVYVYPYLEKQTRVVKVRLEFENPGLELKPDMYANVVLRAELARDALLIPREAYIDSGARRVAFAALGEGRFQPREIQVGVEAEDGMVEVRHGLDEGERVVTSGQFLLDAESKLTEAIAKMLEAPAPAEHKQHMEMKASDAATIPAHAKYACPMESHAYEDDPARRGAFFSDKPGKCDWCGMDLVPIDELDWAKQRATAAQPKAQTAYTCPHHQHIFSDAPGVCPRCGGELKPFQALYTCPHPAHSSFVSLTPGVCPDDGLPLAPFRGVWVSEDMAEANAPLKPEVAEAAAYRCPMHPLAHSDRPGRCPICAHELEPASDVAVERVGEGRAMIPADAKYACPMQACNYVSATPGSCPNCGMQLQPIEEVEWARALRESTSELAYVCPMHPQEAQSATRGTCPICGMQLVSREALPQPITAPAAIAAQMDYVMEHYLALQQRFAADRSTDAALHALGLVGAADAILAQLDGGQSDLPKEFSVAVRKLRDAALKMTGKDLERDRVTFVDVGSALRVMVEHVRPDKERYPRIFIYHCPMSKGDWLQTTDDMANPFYGFKMLKCGELQATK